MPSDDHNAFDVGSVTWLMPWCPLDKKSSQFFEAELSRELCVGHSLYGEKVKALARRDDCDDVLFEIVATTGCLAVVHLTYQQEADPRWPGTRMFASAEEFVRQRMLPDAAGWAEETG